MSEEIKPEEVISEPVMKDGFSANIEDMGRNFGMLFPNFCDGVDLMSSADLKNLLKCLVGVPIQVQEPKFRNKRVEDLFALGDRLLQIKLAMLMSAFYQHGMEQQAAPAQEEIKPEEKNG